MYKTRSQLGFNIQIRWSLIFRFYPKKRSKFATIFKQKHSFLLKPAFTLHTHPPIHSFLKHVMLSFQRMLFCKWSAKEKKDCQKMSSDIFKMNFDANKIIVSFCQQLHYFIYWIKSTSFIERFCLSKSYGKSYLNEIPKFPSPPPLKPKNRNKRQL